MSQLFIPHYRLVEAESSVKSHYVYLVEILHAGKRHTVEKRYSAFHSLHRELRKTYTTPLFPPKRVRNFHPKVLEQRRVGLEKYLQEMLKYNFTRKRVLNFLGLQPLPDSSDHLDNLDDSNIEDDDDEIESSDHQPIFAFEKDPYLSSEKSKFPDILSAGVVSALYGNTH